MTDFDPFVYAADIKAHPEHYIAMTKIVAEATATRKIRKAETLQVIKDALRGPAKAAKASGDTELLGWLVGAATKRRKELETA